MSSTTTTSKNSMASKMRLIWAIVAKDFVDSLKNRQMVTNFITIAFLVLVYRFLPQLGNADSPTRLVLYDAGESAIVRPLERSEAVRVQLSDSLKDMRYQVGLEDVRTIGIVLPEDFDQVSQMKEHVDLEAVIDHWVSNEQEVSMRSEIEAELTRLGGTPVALQIRRQVLTQPDGAFAFQIALGLLIVMGIIGMMYTPQLIVAEKSSRTIDALRVSPATMTEILIAKTLVGGAYCLLMMIVVLVAYGNLVLHWWAMIGAMLGGAFFNVAIGLLLGIRLTDVRQINLWGFIIFQPFILTMILGMFEPVSQGLREAMRWFPTVAMGNAAAQSISAGVEAGLYLRSLVIMIAWGLMFFGLGAWLLRRAEP